MASAKRDIRHIIDSFAEDVILIAQDIAREQVERAVTDWQAKNEKIQARKSIQDEKLRAKKSILDEKLQAKRSIQDAKALRNQKALERIERVAERRREREEKKAAERAVRLEQRLLTSSALDTSGAAGSTEKKPRGRRSGLLADGASKKEPTPPPLFVHKRRRDGEIQQLKRTDDEVAVAAPTPAVDPSASNGAPAAAPVTVPEQLRLGL